MGRGIITSHQRREWDRVVLSTGHYKGYNNSLLHLENTYAGTQIGSISIPQLQWQMIGFNDWKQGRNEVMVWQVEKSASCDRFCIHPNKSHVLWYTCRKKKDHNLDIFLAGDKVDTEGKITLGRKTAYSLMGAGFNGGSGLKTSQNGHIWTTFVIPRLLYGLETQLLKPKDVEILENFQRKCLKQIQGLADNTSNSACLVLLGILPVEAVLHKNLLSLFVSMMQNENSVEYEIAHRQLLMRDAPQESIFTYIKSILEYYDLPSIFGLINNPPTKAEWKRTLNHKIHDIEVNPQQNRWTLVSWKLVLVTS